uniref:Uncharacterized protein n=1 Tax=Cannabis sativa TaxID=3483 RepID=A0A803P007_CANSA
MAYAIVWRFQPRSRRIVVRLPPEVARLVDRSPAEGLILVHNILHREGSRNSRTRFHRSSDLENSLLAPGPVETSSEVIRQASPLFKISTEATFVFSEKKESIPTALGPIKTLS